MADKEVGDVFGTHIGFRGLETNLTPFRFVSLVRACERARRGEAACARERMCLPVVRRFTSPNRLGTPRDQQHQEHKARTQRNATPGIRWECAVTNGTGGIPGGAEGAGPTAPGGFQAARNDPLSTTRSL